MVSPPPLPRVYLDISPGPHVCPPPCARPLSTPVYLPLSLSLPFLKNLNDWVLSTDKGVGGFRWVSPIPIQTQGWLQFRGIDGCRVSLKPKRNVSSKVLGESKGHNTKIWGYIRDTSSIPGNIEVHLGSCRVCRGDIVQVFVHETDTHWADGGNRKAYLVSREIQYMGVHNLWVN